MVAFIHTSGGGAGLSGRLVGLLEVWVGEGRREGWVVCWGYDYQGHARR
jgi:hypothetical protein